MVPAVRFHVVGIPLCESRATDAGEERATPRALPARQVRARVLRADGARRSLGRFGAHAFRDVSPIRPGKTMPSWYLRNLRTPPKSRKNPLARSLANRESNLDASCPFAF